MRANFWFFLIIGLILFDFVFDQVLGFLNSKNWSNTVPEEMKDAYDPSEYKRAKEYKQAKDKLGLISSLISVALIMSIIGFGIFGMLDDWVKSYSGDSFIQAALFFIVIALASSIISMPFSIYGTFVIEERFGFNKTTWKTFVLDKVKGIFLAGLIGGGLLWVVIYILEYFQSGYWYWLWLVIGGFMFIVNMLYADVILPLFNKLKPLEEGELKIAIDNYASKIGYPIKNIYVIDGSKRSTKANAFFSGIGPRKTIALYDTLIEKCTTEELLAILAHEIGHYKKKHILVSMVISLLQMGLTLFLLEFFLTIPEIAQALGAKSISFHVGIIAFGIIFSPVNLITGIFMSVLSRKNEFEADDFARKTYDAAPLISGLKKLSVDSLSNLTPHPAYVFVHYSHPPLLKRIAALRN